MPTFLQLRPTNLDRVWAQACAMYFSPFAAFINAFQRLTGLHGNRSMTRPSQSSCSPTQCFGFMYISCRHHYFLVGNSTVCMSTIQGALTGLVFFFLGIRTGCGQTPRSWIRLTVVSSDFQGFNIIASNTIESPTRTCKCIVS